MTLEQRLIQMLGERDLQIADLLTKLEEALKRVSDLEARNTELKEHEHV